LSEKALNQNTLTVMKRPSMDKEDYGQAIKLCRRSLKICNYKCSAAKFYNHNIYKAHDNILVEFSVSSKVARIYQYHGIYICQ